MVISNQQGNIYLNNQNPFKLMNTTMLPQCSLAEAPKKDTNSAFHQGLESAAIVSLASIVSEALVTPPVALSNLPHSFGGQFVSSVIRNTINQYTDNSLVRTASHAVVQGLKHAYLDPTPTSILNGAIDGAGYSLTSDIADSLKNGKGKETWSSLATSMAGTYLTEMTEAFVACRTAPTLCWDFKLKALVTATLFNGYTAHAYATQA